jgi:hypothetical protein
LTISFRWAERDRKKRHDSRAEGGIDHRDAGSEQHAVQIVRQITREITPQLLDIGIIQHVAASSRAPGADSMARNDATSVASTGPSSRCGLWSASTGGNSLRGTRSNSCHPVHKG